MDLVAEFDCSWFFGVGKDPVVLLPVDEGFLQGEEVRGEEDVGAEGGEEVVEFGG